MAVRHLSMSHIISWISYSCWMQTSQPLLLSPEQAQSPMSVCTKWVTIFWPVCGLWVVGVKERPLVFRWQCSIIVAVISAALCDYLMRLWVIFYYFFFFMPLQMCGLLQVTLCHLSLRVCVFLSFCVAVRQSTGLSCVCVAVAGSSAVNTTCKYQDWKGLNVNRWICPQYWLMKSSMYRLPHHWWVCVLRIWWHCFMWVTAAANGCIPLMKFLSQMYLCSLFATSHNPFQE